MPGAEQSDEAAEDTTMSTRRDFETLRQQRRATSRTRQPVPAFRSPTSRPSVWLLALLMLAGACAREPRVSEVPDLSASDGLVYVLPGSEDEWRTDLWRARLSDGAVRPLVETADRSETWPKWSEQASALVFRRRPHHADRSSPSRAVIWRGGEESVIPGVHAHREDWATWAPFELRLAYAVRDLPVEKQADPIHSGIAIVDLETREQRILARSTHGEYYVHPEFSPDGRRIIAQYLSEGPRMRRIVLLEPEGGLRFLTPEESFAVEPVFTRDGRHILFTHRGRGGRPSDIIQMRTDGSARRPVVNDSETDDYGAAPSPTRNEIAFISNRDGKKDAFLVPLSGGRPRNLTKSLNLEVAFPCWSPDGEHIALTGYVFDPDRKKGWSHVRRRNARVLVLDRQGRVVFRTAGFSPDWMPPWR